MRSFLRVTFVFWLSSCGDPNPGGDTAGRLSDGDVQATATDSPSPSAEPPMISDAVLTLEGEGLRVFSVPTGSARPIPFGTPMDATLDVISRVQQTSPREQGESADCGAEYATWENGFTVWFAQGRFVGWSVRMGSPLTTASGIGVGSTRGELDASYVVQIIPSSLGVEFTAGGLAGLLDSSEPDARVMNLWAGHSCVAR